MAQRLLLNTAGLKISKPGVDVATASMLDLLFDSAAGNYIGVYASGEVNMGAFAPSSEETAGFTSSSTYAQEIMYGKTFGSPPLIFLMFESAHYPGAASPHFNEGASYTQTINGIIRGFGGGTMVSARSYVDRLRIEILYSINTSQLPGPNAISYLIAEK